MDEGEKMGYGMQVATALNVLRNEKKQYKDYIPQEAIKSGNELVSATKNIWNDVKKTVVELVYEEIPMQYPHVAVWWYSVLTDIEQDKELFYEFVKYVRENRNTFSANTQYFLFYQLKRKLFVSPELNIRKTTEELWNYYKEVVEEFAQRMHTSLETIPAETRDEDLVIVITEQFLAIQHGPTKTALDRCRALKMVGKKKVLLINTAEVLSGVGKIPFWNAYMGSYASEKQNEREQIWKGVEIPYHQCRDDMPDIDEVDELLSEIRRLAPMRVVSIGGSSMLSNLVNKMIPVLTIGLSPSALEFTTTKYQTISKKLEPSDIEMVNKLGFKEENLIEGIFTSSLKPQTEHITRQELGVPEDKFLMVVIGGRLDMEVTEEFLESLEEIIQDDMYVGFIGTFNTYESVIPKYPKLRTHSSNLGFCNDILSRLEICDLYVNPNRRGGGTSCVEAMFMGVPVVSTQYGDVAVNAGEAFLVKDYSQMKAAIMQYYTDRDFYDTMSKKAKQRADVLLDTETEFMRIMSEVNKREGRLEENV